MLSNLCKHSISTRVPVTSVVEQSVSALQYTDSSGGAYVYQSGTDGYMSPFSYNQGMLRSENANTVSRTACLRSGTNLGRPRDLRIEFSAGSMKEPKVDLTQAPMLFTVKGADKRLSSGALGHGSSEHQVAEQEQFGTSLSATGYTLTRSSLKPAAGVPTSSPPACPAEYPTTHGNRLAQSDHAQTTFRTLQPITRTESRATAITSSTHMVRSNPGVRATSSSKTSRRDNTPTVTSAQLKKVTPHHSRFPSAEDAPIDAQRYTVKPSSLAMSYVKAGIKVFSSQGVKPESRKSARSPSASRQQYSRPNQPAFMKEVSAAISRLQTDKLYSSVFDTSARETPADTPASLYNHFRMVRKEWKASEPPSLSLPQVEEETLPDGIPLLTANPHELRANYVRNATSVQPIPESSLGFFVEMDPLSARSKYRLKRVQSVASNAVTRKTNVSTDELLGQSDAISSCKLRDHKSTKLQDGDQGSTEHGAIDQGSSALTLDTSTCMSASPVSQHTPLDVGQKDKLTLEELQMSRPERIYSHSEKTTTGAKVACAEVSNSKLKEMERNRSVRQESSADSADECLMKVKALVKQRSRLRSPSANGFEGRGLQSQGSARRCASARPATSNEVALLQRPSKRDTLSSNANVLRYDIASASSHASSRPVSGQEHKKDVYTRLFNNSLAKEENAERRPLSYIDLSRSAALYRTIHGERPIARGFRVRSAEPSYRSSNRLITSSASRFRPDVSLGRQTSSSHMRELSVSAVLPTTSLVLSMAESYIQSQARNKYNIAMQRFQTPAVALTGGTSQRSRSSASHSVARHSRRSVGLQSQQSADKYIDATTQDNSPRSSNHHKRALSSNGTKYSLRTRDAKVGTVELKNAATDSGCDVLDVKSSTLKGTLGVSRVTQKNSDTQTSDLSGSMNLQSIPTDSLSWTPLRRNRSSEQVQKSASASRTGLRRSHSAVFHPRGDEMSSGSLCGITTADILAAKRLVQLTSNPYFNDVKRDVITRHLSSLATEAVADRSQRSLVTGLCDQLPSREFNISGLDIPTIESTESEPMDNAVQLQQNIVADPSINRVASADATISMTHTSLLGDAHDMSIHMDPHRDELPHFLHNNVFSGASATFEMYVGGNDYQNIDLQHHVFSGHIGTSWEGSSGHSASKTTKAKKVSSRANSASNSTVKSGKKRQSSALGRSFSSRAVISPDSNRTDALQSQARTSSESTVNKQYSYNNNDIMLSDLEITACSMHKSALRTANYCENILLKRKTPDGKTKLTAMSIADQLDDNDSMASSVQQSTRSLSASAPTSIHPSSTAHRRVGKRNRFNYPSITGKFPLYADRDSANEASAKESSMDPVVALSTTSSPRKEAFMSMLGTAPTPTPTPTQFIRATTEPTPSQLRQTGKKGTSRAAHVSRPLQSYSGAYIETLSVSESMAFKAFEKLALSGQIDDRPSSIITDANTSGLRDFPTLSTSINLPHVELHQKKDIDILVENDPDKDNAYQSPLKFADSANGCTLPQTRENKSKGPSMQPQTSGREVDTNAVSAGSNKMHDSLKESVYRASSIRSAVTDSSLKMSRTYGYDSGASIAGQKRVSSCTRRYSRSAMRPASTGTQSVKSAHRESRCSSALFGSNQHTGG